MRRGACVTTPPGSIPISAALIGGAFVEWVGVHSRRRAAGPAVVSAAWLSPSEPPLGREQPSLGRQFPTQFLQGGLLDPAHALGADAEQAPDFGLGALLTDAQAQHLTL